MLLKQILKWHKQKCDLLIKSAKRRKMRKVIQVPHEEMIQSHLNSVVDPRSLFYCKRASRTFITTIVSLFYLLSRHSEDMKKMNDWASVTHECVCAVCQKQPTLQPSLLEASDRTYQSQHCVLIG